MSKGKERGNGAQDGKLSPLLVQATSTLLGIFARLCRDCLKPLHENSGLGKQLAEDCICRVSEGLVT